MKNTNYIFLLLFFLLTTSCEEFFISEIAPPTKSDIAKLVIHSYISPTDDTLLVSVKKSRPIFGNNKIVNEDLIQLEDASVIIKKSNSSKSIKFKYNKQKQKYTAPTRQFKIESGKTYQLKVSTKDGEIATATTTVPLPLTAQPTNLKITKIPKDEHHEIKLKYKLKDNPKEINYYIGIAVFKTTGNKKHKEIPKVNKYRFTDRNKNGKQLHPSPISNRFTISNVSTEKIKEVNLKIRNIDKNYYMYIESINRQKRIRENPFVEPMIINSNIKGGIGIFGSYTEFEKTIEIKK